MAEAGILAIGFGLEPLFRDDNNKDENLFSIIVIGFTIWILAAKIAKQ